MAEFDGNPKRTVIAVYPPTNCADEVEAEGFYDDLSNTLQDVPAQNFLACIGDFNARLRPDEVPFTYHDKRPGKLWTFTGRTGSLQQFDYILVHRKWRNSVQNVEAYNTFSTVGSDHRIVCAKIKLSPTVSEVAKNLKYDWKFSTDPDLQ
ncbi:craniofacial development protein 2-like [Montipora foliosa]|uniref:craniofacial development protein 2-like n=1 Tax=Montipora foliosa TaxID=591990 RepID=UPI0035F152F0